MHYRFEFFPYRRRFKPPLQTNHGIWEVRDGIIVRLTEEKQDKQGGNCDQSIGYGEIAPISWFGSETIEQALDFCRQLPDEITQKTIFSIPNQLPACQFGLESAWENLVAGVQGGRGASRVRGWRSLSGLAWAEGQRSQPRAGVEEFERTGVGRGAKWDKYYSLLTTHYSPLAPSPSPLTYSGLLPAGKAALQAWQKLWNQGYRTFKWKIGVYPIAEELEIFDLLTQALPEAKLRLDANGGLDYDEANLWLYTCDNVRANDKLPVEIEFIEQPLSVEQLDRMQELSYFYATAIALDESVATLAQLEACYQQGWRGIFVIKPGIAGSPKRLRQFCQVHKIDAVFSSVFESSVGKQAALKLAVELSNTNRAVGFGVDHCFDLDEQKIKLWH